MLSCFKQNDWTNRIAHRFACCKIIILYTHSESASESQMCNQNKAGSSTHRQLFIQ